MTAASDDFNGSGALDILPTYSASWDDPDGVFLVTTSGYVYNVLNSNFAKIAVWNADTFAANHQASVTVESDLSDSTVWVGPLVRGDSTFRRGYLLNSSAFGSNNFVRIDSSTASTTLAGVSYDIQDGDVLELTAVGTTLKAKLNGGTANVPADTTDATFADGSPGFGMRQNSSAIGITAWSATDAFALEYSDAILSLNPDHLWSFDGDFTDSVGGVNGTNTGAIVTNAATTEDAINCMTTNGTADRVVLATTTDINNSAQTLKTVCGWITATADQLPPKTVYREGSSGNYFHLVMWAGNNVMFEASNSGGVNPQAYADNIFTTNRTYHVTMKIEGTGFGNFIKLYVDGVEQSITSPTSGEFGAASLNARGVAEWGDASGATEVGQQAVLLNSLVNGNYNYWATWSGANAQLTDTQIRQVLFEQGASPDVTITNQTGLDSLADSVRPNVPLCIRVDVLDSIALTADNITFDPLASIHVQYTGTGVLDWTNTNGANASIGSTPGGGTINFINPATLTIEGIISGAEVRLYDDELADPYNFDTELDGIEANVGTTFAYAHSGAANTVVVQMMADGYKEIIRRITLNATNQTLTLFPQVETNA